MLTFSSRSREPEILDDFDLEGHDLSENLAELEKVNRLLGGYAIAKEGIEKIIRKRGLKAQRIRIADIGCGGGDTLRELSRWGERRGVPLALIGVDANAAAVEYAAEQAEGFGNIRFLKLNILSPEFKDLKADVVMFNLFLHHFSEGEIVGFLKTCKSNGSAILINDLQRSRLAYHAFRVVSRIFRFSYVSRHDGKLSVKKSFTRKDWKRMLRKAEIENYRIRWCWAFRYLIIGY